MATNKPGKSRRVYPLSVLFVLIAIASVMVGFLRPIVQSLSRGPVGVAEATMASVGGAIGVAFVGGLVGMHHYNRGRGLMWGIATGLAIGAVLGPASLTPLETAPTLMSIAVGGSMLLVALATFFRLARRE
jgi:hypothetical protein